MFSVSLLPEAPARPTSKPPFHFGTGFAAGLDPTEADSAAETVAASSLDVGVGVTDAFEEDTVACGCDAA